MEILYWTLLIVGGFLLGSIMFCEIIPKKLLHKDIYTISVDNNPGAFNVFKHCGKKFGIPCLLLDILKGFIPVLLASLLLNANNIAFSLVMVAPVLGHAIGIFNHFHGGKCISASFGVMLGLVPITWIGIFVLAILFLLICTIMKKKNASIQSVVVYANFAIIICTILGLLEMTYVAIGCGMIALLPIIKFLCSKNGLVGNHYCYKNVREERLSKKIGKISNRWCFK